MKLAHRLQRQQTSILIWFKPSRIPGRTTLTILLEKHMKHGLPVSLLLGVTMALNAQRFTEPPAVPATSPSAEYPLHLHIFGVHWNHVNGGYEGYGRADLLGQPIQGVDYTFSCSEPFLHNAEKSEFYQAKWKKPNQRLEILMQKVGSDHLQRCELKTALKPIPYGRYGTGSPASSPASDPPESQ